MFSATSANATVASITSAEIQSYAAAVVSYLQSVNYTISGVTSADLQTIGQMYQSLASAPASQLAPWITATNNVLQSSAACGSMGTYPNLNQASFSTCAQDIGTALSGAGAASLDAGLTAGLALVKAAGFPLTIPGTNVTVTLPGTPITPTTPPGTTPAAAKVIAEIITPQIQRATSIQQASIISNVVSNIFSSRAPNAPGAPVRVSLGNQSGMAAGNEAPKLNAWVNVADTTIGSSAAASLFDGKVSNAIGGVDYMVSSNFVAGVSLGYDKVDLNFNFAAGSGLKSSGWMLAPYASYQINDMLSVDGTLGYASGDVDKRDTGVTTTDSYTRDFVALNLNATRWMGDVQFTGKVNYITANEKVATTNKMEQVRLSGQVGYWMDGIMPYVSIAYVQDLKVTSGGITPANLDKDAWVATVGANLFSKGAVYGGIAYTEEFGRTDAKNYTFMANVGYRF
jgi:hypothetical protein